MMNWWEKDEMTVTGTYHQPINPLVGCRQFPPGLWLPSQLKGIHVFRPVSNHTAWWERHIGDYLPSTRITTYSSDDLTSYPQVHHSPPWLLGLPPWATTVLGWSGFNCLLSNDNKHRTQQTSNIIYCTVLHIHIITVWYIIIIIMTINNYIQI